ncbi:MAG: hypothetical protein U0U66_03855 [Cytophagaceae bacterium]
MEFKLFFNGNRENNMVFKGIQVINGLIMVHRYNSGQITHTLNSWNVVFQSLDYDLNNEFNDWYLTTMSKFSQVVLEINKMDSNSPEFRLLSFKVNKITAPISKLDFFLRNNQVEPRLKQAWTITVLTISFVEQMNQKRRAEGPLFTL